MVAEQIKKEVFTKFNDKRYGKNTLLELFFYDKNIVSTKFKSKEISEETYHFFETNTQKLEYINDTISIDYFREEECKKLIDKYCNPQANKESNRKDLKEIYTRNEEKSQNDKISNVEEAQYSNYRYRVINLKKTYQFKCSHCGKNTNQYAVFIDSNIKIECCLDCMKKYLSKKPLKPVKKKKNLDVLDVLTKETKSGKLLWEVRKGTNEDFEYIKYVAITQSIVGNGLSIVKTIEDNETKFTIFNINSRIEYKSLGNLEDAIWKQKPKVIPIKVHIKTEEEKEMEKRAKEKEIKERQENEKKEQELRQKEIERKRLQKIAEEQELLKQKRIMAEIKARERAYEKAREEQLKRERIAKEKEELEKLPQIGFRDFVVRSNVFKCMNASHTLENIEAAVHIIDNNNKERLVRINAGYCANCNVFFIMESTYNNLRIRGIPICRVSDEKTYRKGLYSNGMLLAQESILWEYGYTVGQREELSVSRRQKILAVLIDKKIVSKGEIISYINFFINQRKNQDRFKVAISKWEADREFVENYRIGEYHRYGVNAILRR